jgi:hypothetical protein
MGVISTSLAHVSLRPWLHGKDYGSDAENLARQVKNKALLVLESDMSSDIRKWGSCGLSVIPQPVELPLRAIKITIFRSPQSPLN